jgi:UDP-galactopyranose mutase
MANYDYLVVGAGLFGSVFAHEATKRSKRCMVIERRNHIGGNCYTSVCEGIHVHEYGAHIFRTSDKRIWDYLHQFCDLNHFVNSPVANYYGELYNLPFNMNTFNELWGVVTPDEARAKIASQCLRLDREPRNLEEHVLTMAGTDIYEKLIKGYTEKQWGRPCSELPASIICRLPMRFIFDNNYFNDPYQGIPVGGYTKIFEQLLVGSEVRTGVDYCEHRAEFDGMADTLIYTGTIDGYYDHCFGELEYRSLRFETEVLDSPNYQGVAVMNFTDAETPYTRIIEHKHFEFGSITEDGQLPKTVISREYPLSFTPGLEPYYPIENDRNRALYKKYVELATGETDVRFGGRLGEYRYYDMTDTIAAAFRLVDRLL